MLKTSKTNMFIISVSLRNRVSERRVRQNVHVWQTWQSYNLSVLLRSSVNITVFCFFTDWNICLKEGEVLQKISSNIIIIKLITQGFAVFFPLPSFCRVSSLLSLSWPPPTPPVLPPPTSTSTITTTTTTTTIIIIIIIIIINNNNIIIISSGFPSGFGSLVSFIIHACITTPILESW